MLLYSLLHLTGYKDFPLDTLKNFRKLGSYAAGHPEYGHGAGIETTTGPLGQGLATSVGLALGERMANDRFGDAINHFTYVIASDGDLMEGISHEAISLAGHLKLSKLIVLFDDNNISIDGKLDISFTGCNLKRFESCGWDTQTIDGHDYDAIKQAITNAQKTDTPSLIACKTLIGKGSPNKQGTSGVHGSPLGGDEAQKTREALGWNYPPFEIPSDIQTAWGQIGQKCNSDYNEWQAKHSNHKDIQTFFYDNFDKHLQKAIADFKQSLFETKPKIATRIASQNVLEVINTTIQNTVGGSADLTGSNNTKTKDLNIVSKEDYTGRYIHYGIREHGMAACMNGLALYGGFVPYGGTFLVFSDYSRPAIRLAALMGIRVIHVLTHDSIGLGEDGPTHQPVEHLAALRAIPNLNVYRPCDAVETAECWEVALTTPKTPSCIVLTRQNLAALRVGGNSAENLSAKGGYTIYGNENANVCLIATGSEVEIAVEAAKELAITNISVKVVSIPCLDIFKAQSYEYQQHILGNNSMRIVIEAAISQGWEGIIQDKGAFIGMNSFGASAPYQDLYKHFGITKDAIIKMVMQKI
jgi:transketolase